MIAVTTPALASGCRLAGVETLVVPGSDAAATVQAAAAAPDVGLLLVAEALWATLPERQRASLESLARPVVLAIPDGSEPVTAGEGAGIAGALQRAIGHRIRLGSGVAP